ncbi:MAG: agmatine deiminase family protein [Planctomycetaceae bacterium]|nr:agmatine deiminase family protein [Planctomycetaceae bacterium]
MNSRFAFVVVFVCVLHRGALSSFCQEASLRPSLNKVSVASSPAKDAAPIGFRLPGEFETHRSLLLGTYFLASDAPQVFVDIVRAAKVSTRVVALVNDSDDLHAAQNALSAAGLPIDCVQYLPVEHNTMWVRDYAPLILVGPNDQSVLLDGAYDKANRPADDSVPRVLSQQLNLQILTAELKIDGGNLLSNGEGIVVATTSLIQCNVELGWSKREIHERLMALCNAKQLVFVEPLAGEPTTHADMFATFVSPDTIVVGTYGDEDEENAMILDQNARRLSRVQTSSGPLRVVRIPMPRHDDGVWRTHTNVVYTNQALLVPLFPAQDDRHTKHVLNVYRELLPTRRIIGIDAERISESGGSLHCITMNLGPIDHFPDLPIPAAVVDEATNDRPPRSR